MNWDSFCLYAEVLVAAMIAIDRVGDQERLEEALL